MRTNDFFEGLKKEISVISKNIGIGKHPTTTGSNRENLIKNFLIDLLPKYFQYGEGIIIDSEGNKSKQQDLIIYSPFVSIFSSKSSIYPLDSVSAVIGVKSTLNKKDIGDAMMNISQLKKMRYSVIPSKYEGSWRDNVQCNIFAYKGPKNPRIVMNNILEIKKKKKISDEEAFDNLCVNGEYIITNNIKIRKLLNEDNSPYAVLIIKEKSLPYFLDCMLNSMNIPLAPTPIFTKYLGEFKINYIKWSQN